MMRILVTGACGFVGSRLLRRLRQSLGKASLVGLDNLCRPGSESNRSLLKSLGVHFIHADVRCAGDFDDLPAVDWIIDAAANPSVLAGVDGKSSSRQVIEHNLSGTINMLEYAKRHHAGFILLSTSRVYSVPALASLPLQTEGLRFVPDLSRRPSGVSPSGITESFSTQPPLSLYGVSKKMSEDLALEYHHTFGLPVWINRCGVMAGAGQFGRADQGIVAYWIHGWREGRPLRYLGFGGQGHQVRDCLHPEDLADLLLKQMAHTSPATVPRLANVAGGLASTFSLAELSAWCADHLGPSAPVQQDGAERPFDIAWLALDDSLAREAWDWKPAISRDAIFAEIATFAKANPDWMALSAG